MSRRSRSVSSRSRGQAIVEFTLTLPLLLLLLLGILDGGRVFATWVIITNEAREGARFAVVDTGRDVDAYVRRRTAGILEQDELSVAASVAGTNPRVVQVSLTYRLALVTPLIGQLFSPTNEVLLTAASTMRAE